MNHDYSKCRIMTVVLPDGGREVRQQCGCRVIYRDKTATVITCAEHGCEMYEYQYQFDTGSDVCGCGRRHVWRRTQP
jgi:hypothetical protein